MGRSHLSDGPIAYGSEARQKQKLGLALWLVAMLRGGPGRSITDKLAQEIMDAANGTGGAVKKKRRYSSNG